jgi:hypothetical protein
MNLATAQDVYFRGMWMALSQSGRRRDLVGASEVRITESETPIPQLTPNASTFRSYRKLSGRVSSSNGSRFRPSISREHSKSRPPPTASNSSLDSVEFTKVPAFRWHKRASTIRKSVRQFVSRASRANVKPTTRLAAESVYRILTVRRSRFWRR